MDHKKHLEMISQIIDISEVEGEKIVKFKNQNSTNVKPNKKRGKQSNSANPK